MNRSVIAFAVLGATIVAGLSGALAADKPANVARGKQLYMATGCYQCHGTRGEGGGNAVADALVASGDKDRLACETSHGLSSIMRKQAKG